MSQRPQNWGKCSTFKAIANEWGPLLCKNVFNQSPPSMFAPLTPSLAQSAFRLQRCSMQIAWANLNWANSSSRWSTDDQTVLQTIDLHILAKQLFNICGKKHLTRFWSCGRWGQISEFCTKTTEFLTAWWISRPKCAFSNVFFSLKDVARRR